MMKSKIQYALAVCIFGTTGLILRWTILPSELLVMGRGILGALLIRLYLLLRGERMDWASIKRNGKWLTLGGISLGLNWVFLFAAYRYTTVAVASLCNYTAPVLLLFLAPFLFGESLGLRKILCILAAAAGIVLISGPISGESGVTPGGLLLGMGAALGFVGIVICNKKISGVSPYDKVIFQLLVSALTVLPYALLRNWGTTIPWDWASIFWMAVLAFVHTAIAYCCYFGAMGELPVQIIALWGYIEPVVSVVCSALILSEPFGVKGIVGAVLIIGAAIVSDRAG